MLDVEHDVAEAVEADGVGDERARPPAAASGMSRRHDSSGSIGSPASLSSAPAASAAATGAKMSRPWNVAETGSRRWGERLEVDRLEDAAEALRRRAEQAVVGADEEPVLLGGAQRDRAAARRRPRVDDREVDARAGERQRAAQHQRPVRTSWRGMPWVMSMTRASGAIRAMTPWHTPTKSSSSAVVGEEGDGASHARARLAAQRRDERVDERLGELGRLPRRRELRDGGVDRPVFQIAEVLAGRIGVLDYRNKLGFLGEALRSREPAHGSEARMTRRGSPVAGLTERSAVGESRNLASIEFHKGCPASAGSDGPFTANRRSCRSPPGRRSRLDVMVLSKFRCTRTSSRSWRASKRVSYW